MNDCDSDNPYRIFETANSVNYYQKNPDIFISNKMTLCNVHNIENFIQFYNYLSSFFLEKKFKNQRYDLC